MALLFGDSLLPQDDLRPEHPMAATVAVIQNSRFSSGACRKAQHFDKSLP